VLAWPTTPGKGWTFKFPATERNRPLLPSRSTVDLAVPDFSNGGSGAVSERRDAEVLGKQPAGDHRLGGDRLSQRGTGFGLAARAREHSGAGRRQPQVRCCSSASPTRLMSAPVAPRSAERAPRRPRPQPAPGRLGGRPTVGPKRSALDENHLVLIGGGRDPRVELGVDDGERLVELGRGRRDLEQITRDDLFDRTCG
jgi:hypothetical protein